MCTALVRLYKEDLETQLDKANSLPNLYRPGTENHAKFERDRASGLALFRRE